MLSVNQKKRGLYLEEKKNKTKVPQAEQVGARKTIIFCDAGTGLGLESSLVGYLLLHPQ